jgi:hypothetical protein
MDALAHPRKETDERLLDVIRRLIADGKVKNERQFALEHGLNPSVVYKVRQGIQSFPGELVFEMASRWGISVDYVRYGTGGMYAEEQVQDQGVAPAFTHLPMIDVTARATFVSGFAAGNPIDKLERVPVMLDASLGRVRDAMVIEVEGDSMAPTLQPRDRLVITAINPLDWAHQAGGVYVIVFRDQIAVKRIIHNSLADKGMLQLTSDNPLGGSMAVKGADVLALYRIRQLVRVF